MAGAPSPRESALEDAQWIATILAPPSEESREECYARLLNKYWKVVNVLVVSRTGDIREAEDIAQEAFVRAFRSLDKLSQPRAFLGWLLKITRNLITDHIRSRKHVVSLDAMGTDAAQAEAAGGTASTPDFVRDLERSEDTAQVLASLQELPQKYREVVVLRYLQGMDGKAMAEHLAEPEGTVRNRLFRALAKLREALEPGKAQHR